LFKPPPRQGLKIIADPVLIRLHCLGLMLGVATYITALKLN
jgi:hypothetical protein